MNTKNKQNRTRGLETRNRMTRTEGNREGYKERKKGKGLVKEQV